MGATRAVAICQSVNGALEFQAEHWEASEAALRESISLSRQLGAGLGEAVGSERLGNLLTAQGRLQESLAVLQEGLIAAKRGSKRSHTLARLYGAMARNRLAAEDVPAAAEALSLGLHMAEEHGRCGTCEKVLLPVAVSVHIAQGDLLQAEAYCRQLDREAERFNSHVWRALAARAWGELAATEGYPADAVGHYLRAQAGFEAGGNRYEAAQCRKSVDHLQSEIESRRHPSVVSRTGG